MADSNFRSYRSREPIAREGDDQTARRASSDPLAELARLIGKSDPFADPIRPGTHSDEPADSAQSSGAEWGADDSYPEQEPPAEERYVTPPRKEPLPFLTEPPQEHTNDSEPPSGSGSFFPPPPARFNGFRADNTRDLQAADSPRFDDEAPPAPPIADDRPPVLPPRQAPAFPPPMPGERVAGEIQAAEVGEAYGADDYYEDAPRPRRRGGLVLVIAVLGLAVLGTAGAFAYRAMFGGSVLPSLPPIIKANNGPNKIVPGDSRANSSAQTAAANAGSSEKLVSREEQPVEIQEPPKTAPRVISTIPIAPSGNSGPAPFAPAPAAAAPAAPPAITTVPAAPPAAAPASGEPKKIHTVTIRSDQSGGADAGGAGPASQHSSRSGKISAKASAAAPAPSGNQPLSLAPDSQGDVAAAPAPAPAPAPAAPPPRSRAHAAVAATAPAGGAATETTASGGYAVQVSSQRSEAEAHAAFRSLRAKYPHQLGGREPIVRRADLGAKGIYYRAMVGPFASMEEAAGMCSNLKAAGGTCLVQRN